MADRDEMTIQERYSYLAIQYERYQQASRSSRSVLLDEICAITGLNRNYVTQLLRHKPKRCARQRQRGRSYDAEVDAALRLIWEALDYSCVERLHPSLVSTARLLHHAHELQLTPRLEQQLAEISISTLRRHLGLIPLTQRQRRPPSPPTALQNLIPTRCLPYDLTQPGYFELDLVFHCGLAEQGQFAYTLQAVDVLTGWSERQAILGRSYLVMADALYALLQRLPFPVIELHPDNGSEFLNDNLYRFLQAFYPTIRLSRSRPAHPNDNRLVEQKNGGVVRALLGDIRLDTVAQVRYLNQLYDLMRPYRNYILPVMHQIAKEHVPASDTHSAYTRRKHDTPLPPLERLCLAQILPADDQQALLDARASINPLKLRRAIAAGVQHLVQYPPARSDRVENVYQTLSYPEIFPEACAILDLPYTPPELPCPLPPVRTESQTISQKG